MPRQTKKDTTNRGLWISLAITRMLLGLVFLWAFFDKLIGLGYATPSDRSWMNGGSPTTGFLSNVKGPFADFFQGLAGNSLVDLVFMAGLLGIGLGLFLGVAMRLSIITGSAMLFLMWMASLPLATNPVIDDHIVYIAVLAVLWFSLPFQRLSVGHAWRPLAFVKDNYWLR